MSSLMRSVMLVTATCVLMSVCGCEDQSLPLAVSGYDINGHWVGTTGSGQDVTMDLSNHGNAGNAPAHFSGNMIRAGVTGTFDGTVDTSGTLTFTVRWPGGNETTGEADVYDQKHMKHGMLTDSGTTDTFSTTKH